MNKLTQRSLKPWMKKPLDLIFHAEAHYRDSSDHNKRMAYISFDNAIEVSINTFIHINTDPKGLKLYQQKNLKDLKSYFGKLEVFENYIQSKKLPIIWDKTQIDYYHEQRNHLYHGAILSSPDMSELNEIRQIAFWVFSVLFDINTESILSLSVPEEEPECPQIPEEDVKPVISGLAHHQETCLFIASLIGAWNENSGGDNEIIEEVTSGF